MPFNLTEGCISAISCGQKVEKPVVQLLKHEEVFDDDEKRFGVIISDGIHYFTFGLLARRFNEKIVSGDLPDFTIIRLDQYALIEPPVDSINVVRKVVLILNLTIIVSGREVRQKIGQPTLLEKCCKAAPVFRDPSVSQSSNPNAMTNEMECVEMDDVPMKPCDDPKKISSNDDDSSCIVKMRGLPWSVTVDEISSFLSDCQINGGANGIHLTMSSLGRPSGEAYIELASQEDVAKALQKDRQNMGHRYIEVFASTKLEMDWIVSHSGMDSVMEEKCVRLRGLPHRCTKEAVSSFFSGLQIVPNGINFATDYDGRTSGEAYVQFLNKESLEKALKKHMENIGHRYIEVFRSSLAEMKAETRPKMRPSVARFGRMAPYNRSERFGGSNRSGSADGPASLSRVSRYQNHNYREDSGVSDSCAYGGRSVSQNKPPKRSVFKGACDSEFGSPHLVHMRGLPYKATEDDIAMFFRPLQPSNISIIYDQTNRPSGEATVTFESHGEAVEAMAKDKKHIQNRYIELTLDSVSVYKNNFGDLSSESGSFSRPRSGLRSRGGSFAGGRIERARVGGSAFRFINRVGPGGKLFTSSGSTGFRTGF